jgi:prolyl 4-hydroxylase
MISPPRIAQTAYKKILIPHAVNEIIQAEYAQASFSESESDDYRWHEKYQKYLVSSGISNGLVPSEKPSVTFHCLSHEVFTTLFDHMTPIMEHWAQTTLIQSQGYGIRSYGRGSVLEMHRDRISTHVISCVIHVDDNSDAAWPLDFIDHDLVSHEITFSQGEMLLYESLCIHGRMTPFSGKYYRNLYLHWRPRDWNYHKYIGMKLHYNSEDILVLQRHR